jgi:hypothetical protein
MAAAGYAVKSPKAVPRLFAIRMVTSGTPRRVGS